MKSWPAQADNLAVQQAVNLLSAGAATLLFVAYQLGTKPGPRKRADLKRRLSGVLAHVETVRVAVKD